MIAAHAAPALCPRCNRPVRTGVELHAAAVDLDQLLFHLEPLRRSQCLHDQELHETVGLLVSQAALELRAELAGEHLDCDAPRPPENLVDNALSRAAECAARERATLQ